VQSTEKTLFFVHSSEIHFEKPGIVRLAAFQNPEEATNVL
jgi:calcineurin-like phosphoesterase family protein